MAEVSRPSFWNDRYLAGDTGWDKGVAAPPLRRMLDEGIGKGGRLLVLGAGRGHDALYGAAAGYQVTALDFAEQAVLSIRERAREKGLSITALQEDLFELPSRHPAEFDAILEHTCFCAIDPSRRPEYLQAVGAALKPGGVLFGLFYAHGRAGGPPFTTSEREIRDLFGTAFEIERLVRAPDSFGGRVGEELEAVFRRR